MVYWASNSLFRSPAHLPLGSDFESTDGGRVCIIVLCVSLKISARLNVKGIFIKPSVVLKSARAVLSRDAPRNWKY